MIHQYENLLTAEEIDYLLALPEVQIAKETINLKKNGHVNFTIALTPSLKQTLETKFNINLPNTDIVPMRWIKGDTLPHIDQSSDNFTNTHLIYLTDSCGELIIDTESYAISRGTGYRFSEGVTHKTINTGSEPRLLLGPMSERAITVGYGGIGVNGGTIINIYEESGTIYYQIGEDPSYPISWPCYIQNLDLSGDVIVKFTTDITATNYSQYFICWSNNIQFGDQCLKDDGTRPIITISGITAGYIGFIHNGDNYYSGYSNISIYNLHIHADETTLDPGGGWLARPFFSRGVGNTSSIYNCSSDGPISTGCGGIAGESAGLNGGMLRIIGCYATGEFTDSTGGGIVASAINTYINRCYYTGYIFPVCGGILGYLIYPVENITVENCYTTGDIGFRSGGIICDMDASVGSIIVRNCYSMGNISENAGGIYGRKAMSGSVATNCYSNGTINPDAGGGIFSNAIDVSRGIAINCYASGGTWSTSSANTLLTGIPTTSNYGTVWSNIPDSPINTPYILSNSGYSPYSQCVTNDVSNTIVKGNHTSYPFLADYSHKLLDINNSDPSDYSYITVDLSGQITASILTPVGTYNLKIYSKKNPYSITNYELTILNEIPCFTEDTTVLTPNGYILVSELNKGDIIITSSGRQVPIVNILLTNVGGTRKTYPYIIPKSSIDINYPPQNTYLSAGHLIKYKDSWIHPQYSNKFKQDKSADTITYYNIETPNYQYDDLVINDGLIVETFIGDNKLFKKIRKYRVNKYLGKSCNKTKEPIKEQIIEASLNKKIKKSNKKKVIRIKKI